MLMEDEEPQPQLPMNALAGVRARRRCAQMQLRPNEHLEPQPMMPVLVNEAEPQPTMPLLSEH